MEQNLISHRASVRYCRPKGLDRKRILQAVLLLAICMWLVYLIKNSHHKHENLGNPENLSERNLTIALGRKGMVDYVSGAQAETQDKNALRELEKRENGVGDDEFDVNIHDDFLWELEQEESTVLNGEDEATDSAKFLVKQLSNISEVNFANKDSKKEILDDNGEDVHRVEVFLDENGIPPDATYFINSTLYDEPRGVGLKNLDSSQNESTNPTEIQDDQINAQKRLSSQASKPTY